MHSLELTKPDGRKLTLYSSASLAAGIVTPGPFVRPQLANPHMRWRAHRATQLHAHLFPPYRTRGRREFLAGTELGARQFARDMLPEASAAQLRALLLTLEDA